MAGDVSPVAMFVSEGAPIAYIPPKENIFKCSNWSHITSQPAGFDHEYDHDHDKDNDLDFKIVFDHFATMSVIVGNPWYWRGQVKQRI